VTGFWMCDGSSGGDKKRSLTVIVDSDNWDVWIWVGINHEFLALFSATHFSSEETIMPCDVRKQDKTDHTHICTLQEGRNI
jgi:hypothetical protein